jgi:hypothetical protein
MQVKVLTNTRGGPAHKLADVELVFDDGPLEGLKLVGTAIWAAGEPGEVSITFPARSYQGEGGVRYYNFLRPEKDGRAAMDRLKELIKDEYRRTQGVAA